ncbi:EmrB/QacA subfamily drug resistance transporter [Streptomyces sp. SAI-170]|uniref:MFS transporter n=1 Tax=Streptomyces sp. SAI-170 TaxID=3377729 RepID=UPI003C7C34BC
MNTNAPSSGTGWSSSQRWLLGTTSAAALLVGLDALVVATALSSVRADLGASVEQLEWTVNAYTLTFAVLMMPAAALGDRLGRRGTFVVGLLVFALASAGCALATGIGQLIAARAVQGAGAAAVMPLALALLGAAVPPALRPKALGVFTGVVGASVALGPLLGGLVVEAVSWQWIFWLNLPAVAVLAVAVLARVGESHGPRAALDLPGLVLAAAAVFALVWGLVRGNPVGWGSAETVGALGLGAVLLAGFVARERRAERPMLPLGLFRSRSFAGGNAAIFFGSASAFGSVFFMAQYLQDALGHGPLAAGLRLMPWGAVTMVVPRLVGTRIPRVGARPFIVTGSLLHAAGMAWIALIAAPDMPYAAMVPPMILSGAGVAMVIPATQAAVLGAVAGPDMGKASGVYSTIRQLGSGFGVAVLVAVFAAFGGYASPRSFTDGFVPALATAAALSLAAGLCAAPLRPRSRAAHTEATGANGTSVPAR